MIESFLSPQICKTDARKPPKIKFTVTLWISTSTHGFVLWALFLKKIIKAYEKVLFKSVST